jgi:hypothetical protein
MIILLYTERANSKKKYHSARSCTAFSMESDEIQYEFIENRKLVDDPEDSAEQLKTVEIGGSK